VVLCFFYFVAVFCEFLAPYDLTGYNKDYVFCPPQKIHFWDENGFSFRPFVYELESERNPKTFRKEFVENPEKRYKVELFTTGIPYTFWGLFETNIHFLGVEEGGVIFLLGTDSMGRDRSI
jgi:peptide/nickel transport system permease protein